MKHEVSMYTERGSKSTDGIEVRRFSRESFMEFEPYASVHEGVSNEF
jgi:hypothetical protein